MTTLDQIKSLMKSGDVAEAEALCRRTLEVEPGNGAVKIYHDLCLSRLRRTGGAARPLTTPTQAEPVRPAETPSAREPDDPETLKTIELPGAGVKEGSPCKGRRLTPVTGKGCLRMLLAVLGGLVAMVVAVIAVALFSSWRDQKNVRPMFLYQFSDVSRHWTPREVPEGNFKVALPYGWGLEPALATNIVAGDGQSAGISRLSRYRFDYEPNNLNWLGVEYVLFADDCEAPENIGAWVESSVAFAGIPDLIPPEDRVLLPVNCLKALGSSPDMRHEREFLKKHHNADRMCAYIATVRQGDEYLRAFIVCLQRGREAWRVVKVGPAHPKSRETKKDIATPSLEDAIFAGDVLGSFAILDPERHPRNKRKDRRFAKWPAPLPAQPQIAAERVAKTDAPETETAAERTIKFLWAAPDSGGRGVERKVEEANYAVMLDDSWDNVEVSECKDCTVAGGIERHVRSRLMGPGKTQWFAVEYIRLTPWRPVFSPLSSMVSPAEELKEEFKTMETPIFGASHFVEVVLAAIGWKPDLFPPNGVGDGIEINVTDFRQLPAKDILFMRKLGADDMCSFFGKIKILGKSHWVFVVCLERGQEMWRIAMVSPSAADGDKEGGEASLPTRADMETAAHFIGNFRILSGKRVEYDPAVRPPWDGSPAFLVSAVFARNVEAVKEALALGAAPNAVAWRGVTPVYAALSGADAPSSDILRLLLEAGADPELKCGNLGETPLCLLVKNIGAWRTDSNRMARAAESVRLLLENGADPNKGDGWKADAMFVSGRSALLSAVIRGADLSIIKILVECGGVVTDGILEAAMGNPETLAYLKAKKKSATQQEESTNEQH